MGEASEVVVQNCLYDSKPWIGKDGAKLSDNDIRKISVNWTPATWELYLLTTVDCDMSRNETLLDDYDYRLNEEFTEDIWTKESSVPEYVHNRIHSAIRSLTEQQRIVIRGVYFLGMPHHVIAKKLKIQRATVTQTNTISLNKIKVFLSLDTTVVAYLIGGSANGQKAKSRADDSRSLSCRPQRELHEMNWNEMIEKRRAKELADEAASPIQISGAAYMYEFERAMSQLSPLERTALSLRYVAPCPIARVADGMGMSWDGADELIDRAVQKIQSIFAKSNRGKAA